MDGPSGNGVHKEVTRSFGGNFMLMLGTFFNMKKDGVILVSSNFGVVTEFYSAQCIICTCISLSIFISFKRILFFDRGNRCICKNYFKLWWFFLQPKVCNFISNNYKRKTFIYGSIIQLKNFLFGGIKINIRMYSK